MYKRGRETERITLEYIDAKLDARLDRFKDEINKMNQELMQRHEANLEKMEARLAADREATEKRLAADRKESELRHQRAEDRLVQERLEARRDYNAQRFWLIANFLVLVIGLGGVVLALNGYLPI